MPLHSEAHSPIRPLNVGVLLSGCGVFDGAEIHESTLALLELDRHDANIVCIAPDHPQREIVDHVTRKAVAGQRNTLQESARIARGAIRPLSGFSSRDIDALVIPGGQGVGKNLCSYLIDGVDCSVDADVARLINSLLDAGKPIGAICLAPVLLARVLGARGLQPRLTIGSNAKVAEDLATMGAKNVVCDATEIAVDAALKIVSTPAYMCATRISQVACGTEKLVARLLELAQNQQQ